jgi:hypothetical protein
MAILASTGVLTAGLWMVPILMGFMGYMKYDSIDPESHPRDARHLDNE